MEGTSPPLLKGAGLSPSAILLSNQGAALELQSGRVTNGGRGKEGGGQKEGVPTG